MYKEFSVWIRKNKRIVAKARMMIEAKQYCIIKILEGYGVDAKILANEKSFCYYLLQNYGEGYFNVTIINYPQQRRKKKGMRKRVGGRKFWEGEIYKDGFVRYQEEPFDIDFLEYFSFRLPSPFSRLFIPSKPIGEFHSF
jgi:hypothetical protein